MAKKQKAKKNLSANLIMSKVKTQELKWKIVGWKNSSAFRFSISKNILEDDTKVQNE